MIKAKTVKAIFQRKHTLNFMCLDHREQQVTNRNRILTFADPFARKVISNCEDTAEVIGRVTPLRRKPGVVKVEPAHHRADIKSGSDRVQLVRGAGNPRTAPHRGSGYDGAEHLDASRIIECEQPAAERIHET